MEKQTITFPVAIKDGVVTAAIQFNGNSIKWYQDKPKDKSN